LYQAEAALDERHSQNRFSKVSWVLYLPLENTVELTFETFYQAEAALDERCSLWLNTLQPIAARGLYSSLHVALPLCVLQCVAVCCSVLQCVAV